MIENLEWVNERMPWVNERMNSRRHTFWRKSKNGSNMNIYFAIFEKSVINERTDRRAWSVKEIRIPTDKNKNCNCVIHRNSTSHYHLFIFFSSTISSSFRNQFSSLNSCSSSFALEVDMTYRWWGIDNSEITDQVRYEFSLMLNNDNKR